MPAYKEIFDGRDNLREYKQDPKEPVDISYKDESIPVKEITADFIKDVRSNLF